MDISIVVIDDFYENPEEVRQDALNSKFVTKGTYPGADSVSDLFNNDIINKFSRAMGRAISPVPMSGNYRLALENDKAERDIHTDGINTFVANVCLAYNKDVQGGIALWRHKETGLERMQVTPAASIEKYGISRDEVELKVVRVDGKDYSKWDQVALIPYRFNRCVIIDGMFFHCPFPQGFGDCAENGRLTQHFFFRSI